MSIQQKFWILAVLVLIGIVWFGVQEARGNVYCVAKNGNDSNPGTEEAPWLTIQKAANTLVPGDTVLVKEGIYDEKVQFANDGKEDAYITYKAYPKHQVSIEYSGIDDHVILFTKAFIIFDGFKVNSLKYQPIRLNPGSHHIVIQNCELTGTIKHLVKCPKCGEQITLAVGEGISYHGLLIEDDSVHHVTIQNNKIYGHGFTRHHHGMYIKGDYHLIEGNILYNNAGFGIHMYNDKGSVKHCIVRNNILYENGVRSGNTGSGIIVSQGGNFIYNNICYSNGRYGISVLNVPSGDPPNKIYNNLLYGNGSAGIAIQRSYNAILKNNICANNGQHNIFVENSKGIISDYNCFWPDGETRFLWVGEGGETEHLLIEKKRGSAPVGRGAILGSRGVLGNFSFAGYKAVSGQDTHSICQDPKFLNPSKYDFHLNPNSPCIDAGIDAEISVDFEGNKRPKGARFDIGAYERTK